MVARAPAWPYRRRVKRVVACWIAASVVVGCGQPATLEPVRPPAVEGPGSKPCSVERDVVGELLGTQRFRPGLVERLAISTDGRVVMTAGGASAEIWDGRTGERLREVSSWLGRIAMSADGRRLVVRDQSPVSSALQVVRVEDGEVVRAWDDEPPDAVALALDGPGEILAVALRSGEIELRSVAQEGPGRRLEGQEGDIRALAFSPKAPRLVVAGAKGRLELWNVADEHMTSLAAGASSVTAAAFSAGGDRLVTGDADGLVRIFDAEG